MTPGIRRLITACSLAVIASLPLAAMSGSAETSQTVPVWAASAATPRYSQEGDTLTGEEATDAMRVLNHDDSTTYAVTSGTLPRGISLSASGIFTGTFTESTPNTVDGAAGTHRLTITATRAGVSSPVTFDWHVSRFRKGDVFAGIGGGKYRVFSEEGVFKYELTTDTAAEFEDRLNKGYVAWEGITTGCGYNWVTRRMYFTAFDDDYDPSVTEINPVPATGSFAFPRNKISTFRDAGPEGGDAGYPIDGAPEAVVFAGDGTMYVGHSGGYYVAPDELHADKNGEYVVVPSDPDWTFFYYAGPDGQALVDATGSPIRFRQGMELDGTILKRIGEPWLDAGGNPVRGRIQWGKDVQRWLPTRSGDNWTWTRVKPDPDQPAQGYDTYTPWQGSDALDLSSDQRTLYYTSEWGQIYRYDVGVPGGQQLDPFPAIMPSQYPAYGVRLLPPGDGTGGLIVATQPGLIRYNANGAIVGGYDAPGEDAWFALSISPDGKSVWSMSTSTGKIYRWDLVSGELYSFPNGIGRNGIPSGAEPYPWGLYMSEGLCVMGEYTAAQEVCGDDIDNDGDGEVDELCQPLEACSANSPGDDDLDGLVDSNDPDCPNVVNICEADGYTDSNVAGFCARFNREGDTVSISPAPMFSPASGDVEQYTISGLPPGITANAQGVLSGVPEYTIVQNGVTPDTREYTVLYEVERRKSDGSLVAQYEQTFKWTIQNVNRAPVGINDLRTIRPGQSAVFSVPQQGGTEPCSADPDCEDTVTLTPVAAGVGTMNVAGSTYTWTPPSSTYTGTTAFTYTRSDGRGLTAPVTLTINVVNTPPVAVANTATTRPGVAVAIDVLGNDTDADASPTPDAPDTLTITANTTPSNGSLTRAAGSGTFVYTSNAGFVGTDSFTYTITDGWGAYSTATVTIRVDNRAPIAVDDAVSTIAGYPTSYFNVLTMGTADSDPDADAISITAVSSPSNGTIERQGNSFRYTPNYGFSGVDTFTYTISDPYGLTDTGVVTINVRNLPPVAVNDSGTTAGTRPVSIAVLQNDSDPDNHSISVTGATTPGNGSATVNTNGSITYTANAGFQGVDTFFYTITDGYGGQSTATVTITVGPPNRFDPCLCSTAKASPGEIWPPNHKQTQVVTITDVADPDGGPLAIKILGIYQDEPTNYLGDGDTTIDAGGVGGDTAWVRAERTGNPNVPGNGRVYEIVFEATAPDGSTCTGSVFTGVPHDQGQGNVVIDDGIRYDSTVAGGPIVRTALRVEGGLSDADVTARGFELAYVAEARIGGTGATGTANREMIIGSAIGAASDSGDFNWTSGQQAVFVLSKAGDAVEFKLLTSNQTESVTFSADCANGDCDDVFIRAQSGGTGKITLSGLTLNGLGVAQTLVIPVGGAARSIHLSGLALGEGMQLAGVARIEWTSTPPAGDAVNFRIQVGAACPSDAAGGGGGGATPPLARSDDYATGEDTPLVVEPLAGVILNDLTFAGPLSTELISPTSHGTLTLDADGSFVYTPEANFNGHDTFRYRVSDGALWSEPALVTITVSPAIDPPTAANDAATTPESTPVTIAVLSNDSDPFGAPLSITGSTPPSNGTASISGTAFIYTPNPGFLGVDTFTYTVTGTEGEASATVTVTVTNINEPPVAVDNAYTTAEDTPLSIAAPGILANDSDPDAGDTLSAVLVTGPSNGTLTLEADGSFVYTPAPNYAGTDRYTYRARDTEGLESGVATVTITITPVNDPPVAVDDSYVVAEDSALQINTPGVKSNDSDPDTPAGDLTISLVTGAQRGSLTLNPNGSFIYTPFPDVTGSDSFTYRISDGTGSDTAVATIAITDSPDPPVAVDDAATTQEDTPVLIAVLGNDSDPDSATLTIQRVTPAANGVVTIAGNQLQYAPNDGFSGQDVFTYTITDGQATATATVTVTIAAVNDPPVAVDDGYTTPRNTVLNVQTPGIVGNDSDPEGGSLTARIVTPPTSGSVVLQTHGAFAYTPPNGFSGVASFTYRVNDGAADSNVATVTITVEGSNAAPVAVDDSYTTGKNVPLTVDVPGILANDRDADENDSLTAVLISGTSSNTGTVSLNANGSFTFTPANDFTGTTTFRYRARDRAGATSNEAIVTITIDDVATSGRVCYDGGPSATQYRAQIDWQRLSGGDIRAVALVGRNYADNTYGINKIGWGNKKRDFKAVYLSDYAQLAFFDKNGSKRLDFRIDYLSPKAGTPSGYGTQGVASARQADGGMISGQASNIVSLSTSMDLNMNSFGYVTGESNHPLKSYSPSTNTSYTPNATYPQWIWDMWYEATVKASTFGSSGFGTVTLRGLHASPAKADVSNWRLINCQ